MKTANTKKPPEKQIISFTEFMNELHSIDYIKNNLWYRGTSNSNYKLIPSLFRNKTAKTQSEYKKLEQDLNEIFEMRSLPYSESRSWAKDEWERLFFMQHYRVPTRLLDWSGSPLVSMHFAVASIEIDKGGNAKSDAAIWVLNPVEWNNSAYADTGFTGGILSPKDGWLKRYDPSEVYTSTSTLPPVAMRGVHNSARIVAQQGFFTVFGSRPDSMEDIYGRKINEEFQFPDGCLRKFVIPKNCVKKLQEEIFSLGVSESTIYPDLEGLAAELKRTSGF